ncbi:MULTISPECIES: deoxyribose-phosphate aldolase [Petrotoga]|uniref:Deoxyribose-phosphate aldolase n=2 Tax=Petrotoga sibirica TaxID=156202 RepID=A0A4R8F0L9_9BACT|nr:MULTISPECIES: deoxyribose-phosphate aldolase [Petrotoga]POZ87915.1 deoxyribose-phosphate aldolase [Petrotoga sibirica DSM 13575]POZ90009.1 deoxyribose-phosphate aldolase [Petrotoga sp. SL27]TDX16067.1 deoxyribose-phosphate aldolase [Petrotoga sibirica]
MEIAELKKIIKNEIRRVEKEFTFEERRANLKPQEVAKYIDHTLLKATSTPSDVEKLCKEAKDNSFYAVCVNPTYVNLSKEILTDSNVKVATVIGFPLGANTIETKVYESENAIKNSADELDMVLNIGRLKAQQYDYIYDEIQAISSLTKDSKKLLKVIIETCYLSKEEKIAAVVISKLARADFVKTSTGFGSGGAELEDVALMKFLAGMDMRVKASGGIRDLETALKMIGCGADRIGTSSGLKIIQGRI